MRFSLPSFPYAPPNQRGLWEPVTSTINWCEEEYYATVYAAEIVNTLTNFSFILLGLKGLSSCHKNGHDFIFLIVFAGYLAVGIGSLLFHASQKYPMQLVDELSMIYTTCIMAYVSFSYSRGIAFRVGLAASLVVLSVFITLYYHYLQDPTFHQNVYAFLTIVVLIRAIFIMERTLRPSNHSSGAGPNRSQGSSPPTSSKSEAQTLRNSRDRKILKEMWGLVAFGVTMFLAGFAIWNLDNMYCSKLRNWRRQIGLPWGMLLEGHGWWHLMTALGGYCYIMWGIWLRHCLNDRQDEYNLIWPRLYRLPNVVRVKAKPAQYGCLPNGATKKSQ